MKSFKKREKAGQPLTDTEIGAIKEYLASKSEIILAYLFGSHAKGRLRPTSDVDIAILAIDKKINPSIDYYKLRFALEDALSKLLERDVDVIPLNNAPLFLQYQVLKYGKIIFERSQRERVLFEVNLRKYYFDMKPRYDYYSEMTLAQFKSGKISDRERFIKKKA